MPPLTQSEWEFEFDKYKQYPEFQRSQFHSTFTLSDFQKIYFWEYSHRMYGRLIGFAFTLPLGYYIYKGYINRSMYSRLFGLFALGASQGLIGWWMVRSGLFETGNNTYNNLPKVSPYRLSTHLTFAFLIYGLLLWNGMGIYAKRNSLLQKIVEFNSKQLKQHSGSSNKSGNININIGNELELIDLHSNNIPLGFRNSIKSMGLITFMTVIMGAFVAGNEAGLVYNEWPKMGLGLIPTDLINEFIEPKWKNLFENSSAVQFVHRNLAYATVLGFVALHLYSMRLVNLNKMTPYLRYATGIVAGASLAQATLGVFTLINYVPVYLASLHQMGSLTVLTGAIWLMFLTRRQSLCHSQRLMKQLIKNGKPKFLIA